MKDVSDLKIVKELAKELLNVPVLETEYSPMIVSHPFTNCGIVTMLAGDDFFQADITKNKDAFSNWKEMVSMQIDNSPNVYYVYCLLNTAYRLMFLSQISKFLSQKDFSSILGDAWVNSESANQDANVTKNELLKLFKKANKYDLMSETELETFEDLDDTVVVYRGLGSKNKNNIKALSWTTSFGKAKWFAERWGDKGTVYSATINKENILAYFDRKNEDEVIVDFNHLQNIKTTTKPQPKPESQSKIME